MENMLMLVATCLCGCCSVLSFAQVHIKKIRKTILILWCLTATLVTSTTVLMVTLQVLSKFEYQYVYSHTNRNTALIYKISSLWSGQEGSFLLWAFILSIFGFFVLRRKGQKASQAFGIYTAISFCIFLMCFIAQPFAKMDVVPSDGLGLNEALKDPWMVIHPPLVFISYSAMAVLFSLSITINKNISTEVNDRVLTWLRISWVFLGIGILSGSIWAYRALGWGGYWAWDPIENMALVPWLLLCGYLHRKEYNNRSVCIVPFSVACFGVFLARSGVLKNQSAHAYADGNIIISGIILCLIFIAALYLVVAKIRNRIKQKKVFLTNDRRLIINSFNIYAALIFIGTVAPLVLHIETPMAYYTAISIAFALAYSILLFAWDFEMLKRRNLLMLVVSTLLIIGITALSGSVKFFWLLLLWICLMPPSLWLVSGFRTKSWKYYLSHMGMVLLITGAIGSSALGKEGFIMVNPNSSTIVVEDIEVPLAKFVEKDTLIVSRLSMDILIKYSDIIPLSQGGFFIPYETKPLIILFWIGGFIIITQPCFVFLSTLFNKIINHKPSRTFITH